MEFPWSYQYCFLQFLITHSLMFKLEILLPKAGTVCNCKTDVYLRVNHRESCHASKAIEFYRRLTCIFGMIWWQVFNEVNSRDMDKINVFRGMFQSWVFICVMVATVVFQVIIIEFLGTFASTVPLSWKLWLYSILIGAASMIVAVVTKLIPVKEAKPTSTIEQHDLHEPLLAGPDGVWNSEVGTVMVNNAKHPV